MAPFLSLQNLGRRRVGGSGSDKRQRLSLLKQRRRRQVGGKSGMPQRDHEQQETLVSEGTEADEEEEEEQDDFDESVTRERDEWLERRASIYDMEEGESEDDELPADFLPLLRRGAEDDDDIDSSSRSSSSSGSCGSSVDGVITAEIGGWEESNLPPQSLLVLQQYIMQLDCDDDVFPYDDAEGEEVTKRRRRRRKTQREAAACVLRTSGRCAIRSTCRFSDSEEEDEDEDEGTAMRARAVGGDGNSGFDDDESTGGEEEEDDDDDDDDDKDSDRDRTAGEEPEDEEGDFLQRREEEARWSRWQEESMLDRSDAWGRGGVSPVSSSSDECSPSHKQGHVCLHVCPHTPCKSPFSDCTAETSFGSPFFTSDETDEEPEGSRRRQRRRKISFRQTDDVWFLPAFDERYPDGAAAHVWWSSKDLQSFGMEAAREHYLMMADAEGSATVPK